MSRTYHALISSSASTLTILDISISWVHGHGLFYRPAGRCRSISSYAPALPYLCARDIGKCKAAWTNCGRYLALDLHRARTFEKFRRDSNRSACSSCMQCNGRQKVDGYVRNGRRHACSSLRWKCETTTQPLVEIMQILETVLHEHWCLLRTSYFPIDDV